MKLLKEILGRIFFDINGSNIFLDQSLTNENKKKNKKWDLIKLKSFYRAKEIIKTRKDHLGNMRQYLRKMLLTKN